MPMFIQTTNTAEIALKIKAKFDDKVVILSVAEKGGLDIPDLICELNKQNIKFIGAVFPKIIFRTRAIGYGLIVNTYNHIEDTFIVKDMEDQSQIPSIAFDAKEDYCLFTMVDGLSSNVSKYLAGLDQHYGNRVSYFGCGAGSITYDSTSCIFNEEGMFKNAAVAALIKNKVSQSARYGWEKIAGPFTATKTRNNVIQEINHRNAFQVYKEVIIKQERININRDNFFEIAKAYPIGTISEKGNCIVRDPHSVTEQGEIICIGEVPENTTIDILHGDSYSLIEAVSEVVDTDTISEQSASQIYLCDCISRVLHLEKEYHLELEKVAEMLKVKNKHVPLEGALTFGEISSIKNNQVEFLSKTLLLGLFHHSTATEEGEEIDFNVELQEA